MIKLDLSSFISLCMFISVVGLFGVWFVYECCRKIKNSRQTRGNIWHCDICTNVYVDNNDQPEEAGDNAQHSFAKKLSICPKCGSYNKRKEAK